MMVSYFKQAVWILLLVSLVGCQTNSEDRNELKVELFGDMDSMRVRHRGSDFTFPTNETFFDSIPAIRIGITHFYLNPYCVSLITPADQEFLLTMERPDFAGPTINIIDLNQEEAVQTLSIQREAVEILKDENGNVFVVLLTISTQQGFRAGLSLMSIPLFELYELSSGSVVLNKEATERYNLEHVHDYDTISSMKNPVYLYDSENILESDSRKLFKIVELEE